MKIFEIIKLNLKINKKTLFMWGVILFFIMCIYMILFPYVRDITQDKIQMLPTELTELFNISSLNDMTNYTMYFKTIYGIIIIAISVFSINFASSLIIDEEKNGTINFLINQNISRKDIYIAKLITTFISTLFIEFFVVCGAILCGCISGGDTFVLVDIIKNALIISIVPCLFIAVSFLNCGISYKLSKGLNIGILFIIYMIGYLGTVLENSFISNISPFITMNLTSQYFVGFIILYFILFILFGIVGLYFYQRRDFSI